jgi:uncharacterized protein (DUF2267 family)
MSITGLEVFDSTVHQTNAWLKAIMGRLGTEDRHRAYLAMRTTLQALRDRLQPEMAVHLGAQLPMLVRGVYYEDWHMAGTPTRERHKEEFLAHVATAFRKDPEVDAERVARAVLATLAENIDAGQVNKIIAGLPHELRELWPEPAAPVKG